MDREEFQKKYDNSILVCCTENSIKKVFNICDLMDLTASKSKQITAILIGEQTAKSPLFHVEQFLNDFYNEVGATKKTILFKQRIKDAEERIRFKYNNSFIKKGTNMGTIEELIKTLEMPMGTTDDTILVGEGGEDLKTYQARQFITDVMANMLNVVDPFTNKETMIEIKEDDNAELMMNEAEFYITSIFTAPLHKEYDIQRKVLSIGFGNKKRVMIYEEDFLMFLKSPLLLIQV